MDAFTLGWSNATGLTNVGSAGDDVGVGGANYHIGKQSRALALCSTLRWWDGSLTCSLRWFRFPAGFS